jgi:hypothetical protein
MTDLMVIGLHTLQLVSGATVDDLVELFNEVILPTAAETPGSVNRGGQSAIADQHLLKSLVGDDVLWLVKASGVFDAEQFQRVLNRMYDDAAPRLQGVCNRTAVALYEQVAAFDVGPRDVSGQPTGPPHRDVEP